MLKYSILFAVIALSFSCGRVAPPTPGNNNPTVDPNYGKTHYTWVSGVLGSRERHVTSLKFNSFQDIHFTTNGGFEVFIPKMSFDLIKNATVDSNMTFYYFDYSSMLHLIARNFETRTNNGKMLISRAAYSMSTYNSYGPRYFDLDKVSQNPVVYSLNNQTQNPTTKLISINQSYSWPGWQYDSSLTKTFDVQTNHLSFSGIKNHNAVNIVDEFQTSGYGDLDVYFVHDSVRINTNAIQGDYSLYLISKDKRSFLRFPKLFRDQNMTPNGALNQVKQCVPLGEEFDLWAMVIHKGRLYYQKKSFTMDTNSKTFTMDTFTLISVEDLMKELDKYTQ